MNRIRSLNMLKFLLKDSPHSLTEATQYILNTIRNDNSTGIARYAVLTKKNNQLIGFCGFESTGDNTDFGWRYDSSSWANGYGTEAALAIYEYGITNLKLKSIVVGCSIENIACVKIIQKLKFSYCHLGNVNGRETIKCYQHLTN